jgi:hypothetical protein
LIFSSIKLRAHARTTTVTDIQHIELNVNNEQHVTVNTHLLSMHSKYFKSLFTSAFVEYQQTIVSIHLPGNVSTAAFRHLIDLVMNDEQTIEHEYMSDIFQLCDHYLFDYLPFRLVAYVLERFIHGQIIDIADIVSKPNLISSLVRACFLHLLTSSSNISTEIFSTLLVNNSHELHTLVLSILQHKCWFDDEYSPFLS